MKVSLVTSPHLDHSVFHRVGRASFTGAEHFAQAFAPMGLVSLAAAVGDLVEVQIHDINKAINSGRLSMTRAFYHEAAEWLLNDHPDLIGFMTEADSYHHLLNILRIIKQKTPSVLTLLGGVHATAVHRETIELFRYVDFVIRGEGEVAFRSLTSALRDGTDIINASNLTYRRTGFAATTPDLPLIDDLDTLPWPDFSRLALSEEDVIYLEVGRGCPFKCNFCFTAPYWQRKHRIKSAGRILQELRYFRDAYGRSDFNFTHDLFTTNRRWVIDFCRQLAESELRVTWTCSSRTDTLDEEQIEWMSRAGCRNIYFGVEAGTQEMQAAINKDLDLVAARQIVEKTTQAGIGVTVGFIAGLPGESQESLRGTLRESSHYLGLPNATVHVFGFSPYRGSPHFDRIKTQLVFDPHFVDFPLHDATHSENCAFMEKYFGVFSRYSRLGESNGLSLEVIRATEELFPIVNALNRLFVVLARRNVDPLDLVTHWAKWIFERNRTRCSISSGLYQGTVNEFLLFLRIFLDGRSQPDPVLDEVLRWETAKHRLSTIGDAKVSIGATAVKTNPTLIIETFNNASAFLGEMEGALNGSFAFYKRPDSQMVIVRLPPIARLALNIARDGISRAGLADILCSDPSSAPYREKIVQLVDDLEQQQLLLGGRSARIIENLHESSDPAVSEVVSLSKQITEHRLFAHLRSLADVRRFMEHHVWAVWDFMTLLKSLQADIAPTTLPWRPVPDCRDARLINEIVLGEETDTGPTGRPSSHFEVYLSAMEAAGADTSAMHRFLELVGRGLAVPAALEESLAPRAATRFVRSTLAVVQRSLSARVAAFTLGREDIIPSMFRRAVTGLAGQVASSGLSSLLWYLDRHIVVDDGEHGPMAGRLFTRICLATPSALEEALAGARFALTERLALWDAVLAAIEQNEDRQQAQGELR